MGGDFVRLGSLMDIRGITRGGPDLHRHHGARPKKDPSLRFQVSSRVVMAKANLLHGDGMKRLSEDMVTDPLDHLTDHAVRAFEDLVQSPLVKFQLELLGHYAPTQHSSSSTV